jgi:DNA-binding response OmpR family regulator
MSDLFKVFVVDDDPIIRDLMQDIIETNCTMQAFDTAEACLLRLETDKPDMFLLDVSLPGMDGYDLCRKIKDDEAMNRIPVTFVSSHDTVDAKLRGYDAGGQDFVVKPFKAEEVRRKIKVAQQIVENQLTQESQTKDARYLASLVMANMDETGHVLAFMRQLISYETEREVAAGLLDLAQRYGLDSVVQTRIGQRTLTVSAAGTNIPLETSVLNHLRGMDRIFEFRQRSAYNFKRITLMINNMPLHDPDFCGRLRDNLCFAGEAAEARLWALETEEANQRSQTGIRGALERVRAMTTNLHQAHLRDRATSSDLFLRMEQGLANSFIHLGMSEDQERHLGDMIHGFMSELLELLDRGEETHEALQELGERLGQLAPAPGIQ